LIGIHWSLALSSMILLAVTVALLTFASRGRRAEELGWQSSLPVGRITSIGRFSTVILITMKAMN